MFLGISAGITLTRIIDGGNVIGALAAGVVIGGILITSGQVDASHLRRKIEDTRPAKHVAQF